MTAAILDHPNEAPFMRKRIAKHFHRSSHLRPPERTQNEALSSVQSTPGVLKEKGAPIVSYSYSTSSLFHRRQQLIENVLYISELLACHGCYSPRPSHDIINQRNTLRHSTQARAVDKSLDESQAPNQIYSSLSPRI